MLRQRAYSSTKCFTFRPPSDPTDGKKYMLPTVLRLSSCLDGCVRAQAHLNVGNVKATKRQCGRKLGSKVFSMYQINLDQHEWDEWMDGRMNY